MRQSFRLSQPSHFPPAPCFPPGCRPWGRCPHPFRRRLPYRFPYRRFLDCSSPFYRSLLAHLTLSLPKTLWMPPVPTRLYPSPHSRSQSAEYTITTLSLPARGGCIALASSLPLQNTYSFHSPSLCTSPLPSEAKNSCPSSSSCNRRGAKGAPFIKSQVHGF